MLVYMVGVMVLGFIVKYIIGWVWLIGYLV